ncbi:ESPR-type extended signal peptide-containing protein [Burkholderia sp. MS455]|uniref:beta strand repeat-containing protein n=1 Tax=Burkholderia sp. MS455 TaxID=2811788 RepID=UPI001EF5D47B|nr:ESPR-type extended signal peptide-containing protein [Burkholderia sp. MS455]
MNKTYRNIWNTATGTWTAVAETARSRSKGSARAARQAVAALALGSASIGGAFAADACTTEDGKGGSLDAAGVCKVTASRSIGTDAIGTTAALTDDYIKVNSSGPLAAATGANAVAMGQSVTSSGSSSVAIGSGTSADGLHSMALGASSRVVGDSNLAVGDGATVSRMTYTPTNAVAIGMGAQVSDGGVNGATGSIAIGNSASAAGTGTIMIGTSTRHSGSGATVVGANASAMGGGAGVAMGASSSAAGNASVAMGPNATSTGLGSIAIGNQAATANNNSVALGNAAAGSAVNTTAIGSNARATGTNATVLGQSSSASGLSAIGIGFRANAQGANSVTLGVDSAATSTSTVAIGNSASASGTYGIALGATSVASGNNGAAIGNGATAAGSGDVAIGLNAMANHGSPTLGQAAVAIGSYSNATGAGAVALGGSNTASGSNSAALGIFASAGGTNSVALGASSVATDANTVSVGSASLKRKIVNVDAGTAGTDAVNVDQMNAAIAASDNPYIQVLGATSGATAAVATGSAAMAIGNSASATGTNTLAMGSGASASGMNGIALGATSVASGNNGAAIGTGATAAGSGDVAIGLNAVANHGSPTLGQAAVAIGSYSNATGAGAVALGGSNTASGSNSAALGIFASAAGANSVALGASSVATDANTVSVGSASLKRKIVNMDAGAVSASSTEAVNGSQLHGVADSVASAIGGGSVVNADGSISAPSFTIGDGSGGTTTVRSVGGAVTNLDGRVTINEGAIASLADQIGNGTVGLVQQSAAGADITVGASTDGAAVNFTGTAGARKLTGVDAGAVSASSTDAVNGSQLHGVADSVASAIGGGSVVNADGSISAPSFTVGDGSGGTTTVRSVGGAVANLDGRVTTNEGDIASLADQIGSGTVGLVQQAGAGADITVGANTDGAAVNFAGTTGARKLTGVDAGAVSAASTDAVNGSQLHGVADSVASAIGGGSVVNADGSISAPSFTVGDGSGGTTTVHSVGDVVTNLDGRVTTNEGAVASLADQIGSGTVGLVQQAGPGANLTVGANTDGTAVSFVGTAGARKLSGVANGVNDDDAVTIAQLKATGLIDYTGKEIAAVTYDDISLASVTFGGSAGTKLLNVAPGLIAAGSMEAVNGGQLHDLQDQFAQKYAELDGRVGDLEAGGGSGGGGGGGSDGNVGRGTGGDGSLVVGNGSAASGENSSAIGQGAAASGDGSTAVGQGSNASGGNSSAIGQGSNASGSNSSAIGQGAVASGDSSTAIGQGSSATGSGSVAIGAGSVATEANTVSFGDGTAEGNRRLVNIADGVNASDAATKGQLDRAINGMQGQINDVAKNAYAGVAAAMAMPNLTPSQPGKTVVAAGAANYKSGSAIAAGATYRTRDGKWLMNGAVSVTSTGDAGVRAQVGYEF